MDHHHEDFSHSTGRFLCFKPVDISSSDGWWVGNGRAESSAPLVFAQIALIFVATRFSHFLLRRLGLPQFISQVIAGIILGPSFLSRDGGLLSHMFPLRSWIHLNSISLISYILCIFVVAVKTDLTFPRKSRKKAFAISQFSTAIPFFLVNFVSQSFYPGDDLTQQFFFVNNFSGRWATTSNAVIFCLLTELNLLTSKLGRLAMTTSLISDIQAMVVKSVIAAFAVTVSYFSIKLTMYSILALASLVGFIVLIARPMVIWMIRRTPEGMPMDEGYLLAVMVMALVCGVLGEVIGQNIAMGAMLFGLVLPGGPPLGTTLVDRLERLMEGVFLPVYVAIAGLSMNVWDMNDASLGLFTVKMVLTSVVAKFAAVIGTAMYFGMAARDAIVLALMLNCRGIIELYSFRSWKEARQSNAQMYSIQILSMVVVGGIIAPLLKLLYNPSKHYIDTHKRRSVGQSLLSEELRALACTHDEHNASPLISLLDTSLPLPTSLFLLHLSPLVGHTTPVLSRYKPKRHRKWAPRPSVIDHIVNAFRYLEDTHAGYLSLHPFMGVSPYATMHNDICQLAFDNKIAIILLPFHRYANAENGVVFTNPAVRAVNINVLHYAPCSVGIFLDYGASGGGPLLLRSVVVYFIGGADDHEALAYAARMANNVAVGMTVIRLVLPPKLREGGEEEEMDEEAVSEFRAMSAGNKRVDYWEEEVKDGAEMIEVVKGRSREYSLVIVGRRQGERSRLTAGMEMWSEHPELGVVGDVLASADMGEKKVSMLVVQKRPAQRVGEGHRVPF